MTAVVDNDCRFTVEKVLLHHFCLHNIHEIRTIVASPFLRYKQIMVEVSFFQKGWVTLSANFRRKGTSPTDIFWYQKTRLITLSCDIKISAVNSFASSQSTRVPDGQTDGQTDRRTDLRSQDRASIAASRGTYRSTLPNHHVTVRSAFRVDVTHVVL